MVAAGRERLGTDGGSGRAVANWDGRRAEEPMRVVGAVVLPVNNVGFFFLKPAVNVTPEELSSVMAGNLESCFHLSQLVHPLLKASGKGNIVNISGISTVTGFPTLPICVFSTAKGN
ncbi:hypothetical protein OsI_15269 [Oryza sativa Indica Group]|uniref:Uncharacterized protein n=1 Tax=Oryza sativa subsp. indica TaxID=39946 RepID=B8AS06_ORYSI|nr:hypothetical protein OsI_15269 [Oryza sativa Indica Group]